MDNETADARHRVVVIGSGFGGLFATRALRRAPVDVTLIDRTTHHLFQPLLYQLATGILSEGEIAPPTREILRRQRNARVLAGEVRQIDVDRRTVTSTVLGRTLVTPYDSLIVAAGSGQSYFGNDRFAEFAPSMKSIDDALELRARIFGAFELAELEADPRARAALTTFVVVGGGPTGVEMAGQLAELSRRGLRGEFRSFDPARSRVVLVEAGPAVLPGFGDKLSAKTRRALERLGVEVQVGTRVVGVDATGVDTQVPGEAERRIPSAVKVWAAGVSASPLGGLLASAAGVERNRSGQLAVDPDCTLPGHPEVFVVGDMMQIPGRASVAQVAIQSGRFAARRIRARLRGGRVDEQFRYRDKGTLATISRFRAVASIGPIRTCGFIAWLIWLVVHLCYIVGFRNRVTVVMHWAVSFLGRGRSERAITLRQARIAAVSTEASSTAMRTVAD
ncbi:MAG: FAD-dependent oxidoreductase [Catenulispora sp. 13_1_20CM_3_70_7]|nr:MAG: FAD-dependent oxidoreductase [Catenulispora sp. 13_1_20CM_3_70_7]